MIGQNQISYPSSRDNNSMSSSNISGGSNWICNGCTSRVANHFDICPFCANSRPTTISNAATEPTSFSNSSSSTIIAASRSSSGKRKIRQKPSKLSLSSRSDEKSKLDNNSNSSSSRIEPKELDFHPTPPDYRANLEKIGKPQALNNEAKVETEESTAFDLLGQKSSTNLVTSRYFQKPTVEKENVEDNSDPSTFSLSSASSSSRKNSAYPRRNKSPWKSAVSGQTSGLIDDEISSTSSNENLQSLKRKSNCILDSDSDDSIVSKPRSRLRKSKNEETWKCDGCYANNGIDLYICKICGCDKPSIGNTTLEENDFENYDYDSSGAAANAYFDMETEPEIIDITDSPPASKIVERNRSSTAVVDLSSNDDISDTEEHFDHTRNSNIPHLSEFPYFIPIQAARLRGDCRVPFDDMFSGSYEQRSFTRRFNKRKRESEERKMRAKDGDTSLIVFSSEAGGAASSAGPSRGRSTKAAATKKPRAKKKSYYRRRK